MDTHTVLIFLAIGVIAAGIGLLANDRVVRLVAAIAAVAAGAVALLGVLIR